MGYGDQLMATGLARGAAARGKRIAFGDGDKIIWDRHSEDIFRHNPNIAPRSLSPNAHDIEWIPFYRGHRLYNREAPGRWLWNYDFRATPGEMFFDETEQRFGRRAGKNFVVIEPNVPGYKSCAPNKQWPFERYEEVAKAMQKDGHQVLQLRHDGRPLAATRHHLPTPGFRLALSVLRRAALYIGPEGGLHHGAATVGVPAVVLFGGFIPPAVTGYAAHANLTGGAEACGSIVPCDHCRDAMDRISVDDVLAAARMKLLQREAA